MNRDRAFWQSSAWSIIHKRFIYLLLCIVGHCGLKHVWFTKMFFFITVTEVYLVVPGYQIHLVSVHRKSWLVYQLGFLYYSDGSLPCSARIPDTSGVSTPEELNDLITCFNPQCHQMYLVSWHYKVDFRHCNKEKHVGKSVNSSGVLIPDVSGNLALQGRLLSL
jgi:hypothetical protein